MPRMRKNTLHRWISFATAKLPARNLKRGSLLDHVQAEQLAALADRRIVDTSPSALVSGSKGAVPPKLSLTA